MLLTFRWNIPQVVYAQKQQIIPTQIVLTLIAKVLVQRV
jgi:hypothetical protein